MNRTATVSDRDRDLAILIVESDRRVRSALARLIGARYARAGVVEAENAEIALTHCDSRMFDLALIDTQVPDLAASCALIALLKRDERARNTIAMGVLQNDTRPALDAGALDFVMKSHSPEVLMHAIDRALTDARGPYPANVFHRSETDR